MTKRRLVALLVGVLLTMPIFRCAGFWAGFLAVTYGLFCYLDGLTTRD